MKATVKIVTITPAMAKKLLANLLPAQRPTNPKYITRIANEMLDGTWRLAPDCLVQIKGQLGNGQHRLHGVVNSNTTQRFLMLETDDDELYKIIDCGDKRTVADVLHVEYANDIAATARTIVLYDLDVLNITSGGTGNNTKEAMKCTRSLVIEFAQSNHEKLTSLVAFCSRLASRQRIIPVSMASAVAFVAKRDIPGSDAKVDQFIQNVFDGDSQGDAARDFRERIVRSKVGSGRLPRWHVMALMIKSLRSYLNGTRMSVVRISDVEEFPRIK